MQLAYRASAMLSTIQMVFTLIGFLFKILAYTTVFTGAALLIEKQISKSDSSAICPYIAISMAIIAIPMIYAYAMEAFIAWYGANKYEAEGTPINFLFGSPTMNFALQITGLLSSQLFWIPIVRHSPLALFLIGLLLLIPASIR